VPSDGNVTHKEAEKKLKYKSLCTEIQRMWNMKCSVIPVVTEATGTVTTGLRKYLEEIPGKHSIDSLQSHPGDIAYTKESATVRSLKPEWSGAPLVQGKEHRENPVLRDGNNKKKTPWF
jgi:hypothetical protein